jgi:hypothetical protein
MGKTKQNEPRIYEAQEEKFNVEILQDESIRTLFVQRMNKEETGTP